MVIYKSWSW